MNALERCCPSSEGPEWRALFALLFCVCVWLFLEWLGFDGSPPSPPPHLLTLALLCARDELIG